MNDDKKIEILRQQLKLPLIDMDRIERLDLLRKLLYSKITKTRDKNDIEKCKEMDDIAQEVIVLGSKIIANETLENQQKLYRIIKESYQFRGRRYFRDFLIATEWNFDDDMKFYNIRKLVFDEWVEYFQDLEEGKLKGLSISAPPRTGKALSDEENVLTPTGWKKMKNIKMGDYVIGADGKPAEVLGVFPQGIKDMYRVTFDDRTSVRCSGDHMWTVQTRSDRNRKKERIIKTTDMINKIYTNTGIKEYSIELVKPVEFENTLDEDDLNPYLVGALIGNGTLNRPDIGFTTADKETLDFIKSILPPTDKIVHSNRYNYYIVKRKPDNIHKTHTANKLIEYELYGHKAIDKFIPKKYLYSSIENRMKLLRGLMDTDGCCNKKENTYKTVSKKLALDFSELVRSLGGKAFIRKEKKRKDTWNEVYTVSINQLEFNPFKLSRKKNRDTEMQNKKTRKRNKKYITSIEKIPDEKCTCIYVNNESHLFVTSGYNLTHNTGIGTEFFMWCGLRHPSKSCFFVSHTRSDGKKSIYRYNDVLAR